MQTHEIDRGESYTGLKQALGLVLANTRPEITARLPLGSCAGYIAADDIKAKVNSPTDSVALKDGFALHARDAAEASFENPVKLKITGSAFAGGSFEGRVGHGEAVRICTGSSIPDGADAVVPIELCQEQGGEVLVCDTTRIGRNIFGAGQDVSAGSIVICQGEALLPGRLALAAAGGVSEIPVYPKPRVALIAVGDEVVAPGVALKEGQLYSSNLVNLGGWLACFNISYTNHIARDEPVAIRNMLLEVFKDAEAIITCGGAWASERDLVAGVLDELAWQQVFRFVRMGPGKGVTFGMWQGKPVFCLPGSPPSNDIAFLELSLPGVLNMSGVTGNPLPLVRARLTHDVDSRSFNWTEFHKGKLHTNDEGDCLVTPYTDGSRLRLIADSDCLIRKEEYSGSISAGETITVQVLRPAFGVCAVTE